MKIFSCFLFGAVFSLSVVPIFAQSKAGVKTLQSPSKPISVDGNLKDWGDSLSYHNEAKKLNYGLARDQENFYFAIRIPDRQQQEQAMQNGITLNFAPEGKKKEMFSLTFPSPDQGDGLFVMPQKDNAITEQQLKQENMEDQRRAELSKLRDITVKGFKDIETDHITTANTYGIKTVLNLDAKGALVYEAAIPIRMLHLDKSNTKPWTFDIKINNAASNSNRDDLKPPGEAGGMGNMGRGGMSGGAGRMGGGGMRGGRMGNPGSYDGQGNPGKAVEIKDKFVW